MNSSRIIYALLFTFITSISAISLSKAGINTDSPSPTPAEATELMNRPLIIESKYITQKEREKLSKNDPETLAFMETYYEYYNSSLLFFFSNNGKTPVLMKDTSIDSLVKTGTKRYSILRGGEIKRCYSANNQQICKDTYTFALYLSEDKREKLMISFLEDLLSDSDFLFLTQQYNRSLECAAKNIDSPGFTALNKAYPINVKGKTLLISEGMLSEKLTEEDVKKEYTLPFEILPDQEYEARIVNKTPGYIYLRGTFISDLGGYVCEVINAEDGSVLLIIPEGGVTFTIGTRPSKESMQLIKPGATASRYERNKYAINFVTIKPKYRVKTSYLRAMINKAED